MFGIMHHIAAICRGPGARRAMYWAMGMAPGLPWWSWAWPWSDLPHPPAQARAPRRLPHARQRPGLRGQP